MEQYEAYQPPQKKGFYLDPRTKVLFMAFITTLMFFVYENLAMDAAVAIIPLTLLLINRQVRTALIYGGLFALAVVAKLTQGMYVLPSVLNMISVLLVAMVIRLFPIFMLGYYIIESTSTDEFVAAMEKWHVPEAFIIPITVVIRFIPTLGEESAAITDAILTNEFESSEFLDRWVKAVRRGTPMVVSDAEEVKDLYPDEYQLYERLGIKSVLAIPLEPRQIALIAVRNPQRYIHQTSMLKLLAYVLLAAYNDKRMADSLSMAFSPENIKSSHDVFISLFGELKIHTSRGVLPGSDLKSPKISRLLTFMLLSKKKALSSLEIVQEIWPEELEDKDEPGKKVKQLVYRLRQAFSIISDEQLILSTPSGYQFNPDLNITTDFQMFDELCIAAAKATSTINKVGLLEKAASLYQGKLLSTADGEHWLVHYANRYHLAFMSTVNELLKQLMDFHAYDLLHQDAALALTIAPENTKAYYWLICSYRKQHMDELASGELAAAKQKLPEDEYQKLLSLLE